MSRRAPRAGHRSGGPAIRTAEGTILLDRRQFLRLAAAGGIVAAGTAAGWRFALAQDAAAAEAATPTDFPDIVTAMAASLGHDPERIHRFVAEEVRYEPYAGILRGANGTLVARAGNSADQAVLLAELLRASGVPVRFATGTLDVDSAATLLATTVVDHETARERALQSILSDEDVVTGIEWSVPGDIPPEEVAGLLDLGGIRAALEHDRQALAPRVDRHLRAAIDTITSTLAAAGKDLPATEVSAMPPLERERHVWVQVQEGPTWLDLDPTFADLAPGESATDPVETLEALPDELRHIVDFTVIAETLMGGALVQEPILEVSFFADELAYRGLLFGHARAEDLGDIDLIGSGLGAGSEYNALLVFGPLTAVAQRSISIGGAGGGGMLIDPFGGGGGEGLVEGETSAEWLDIGVLSPGGEPVMARRPIFDRVGTAMRESGVVDPYAIPAAELIDLADGAGAQYLPTRAIRAFSVTGATPNAKMLLQELAADDASAVSMIAGVFDSARALLGAEQAGVLGSQAFTDTPAVTSLLAEPTATGMTVGLDVWHRPFGTLGLAGIRPSIPPALLAGVIPHAVERAVMEHDAASSAQPAAIHVGVGAVLEAAAAEGIPTRLLEGSLPVDAAYDAESQRLLRRALEAGQLIIVPERPVDIGGRPRLGWWRVDPVSGAAVDEMDDGGGQEIAQKAILLSISVLAALGLAIFAPRLFCIIGIDAEALRISIAKVFRGDDSETPGTCGAPASNVGPPTKTMRPMEPATPYSSGPPEHEKAQRQWKERTRDRALH